MCNLLHSCSVYDMKSYAKSFVEEMKALVDNPRLGGLKVS